MNEIKNQIINGLIEILNRNHLEEELHQYISKYALLMFNRSEVYSKLKLGSDYVTDFATCLIRNWGNEWVFIEIELGSDLLFTKSGNPTSKLTHSISQVILWREWILENRHYIVKTIPAIGNPKCIVIIGRRHTLSEKNKKLLRQMNDDYNGKIEIVTFDYLIDNLKKHPKCFFEAAKEKEKAFSAFDINYYNDPKEESRLLQMKIMGFDSLLNPNE